jgi:hypothetical protein
MGSKVTEQNQVTTDNARIGGVKKRLMTVASILVDSVSYTPAQVIGVYQDDLDGMAAVAAAKLALADARAKATPAAKTRQTFDRSFKLSLEGQYGNSPATLGDFGIVMKAPKEPSVQVKAGAVAKRTATRDLRHTMGKTQKEKLSAAAAANATGGTVTVTPTTTGVATPSKS